MKEISLILQDNEYQFFLDLLKNLTSVKIIKTKDKIIGKNTKLAFSSMTNEEIIDRVFVTEKQIENGEFSSNEDFYDEFKRWK